MIFSKGKSPFIIAASLTVLSYLLSILALKYKGVSLEWIAHKSMHSKVSPELNGFLFIVLSFIFLKILSSFINTIRDNLSRFFIIKNFEESWRQSLPNRVLKSDITKSESFFLSLYENIPKLFETRLDSIVQVTSALIIFSAFIFKIFQDRFWIAFLYFPILAGLSAIVTRVYSKRYADGIRNLSQRKSALMKWIREFFLSHRELHFNWQFGQGEQSLVKYSNWYFIAGSRTADGLRMHAKTALYRDFIGSMGVDWPYIFCISATLLAAARGGLSIADAIVWIGLTDYLVTGNHCLRGYFTQRTKIKTLQKIISDDLAWLTQQNDQPKASSEALQTMNSEYKFNLLDGSVVQLSTKPGFYHLKGANGSGKTTLVDTIIGYNVNYDKWSKVNIQNIQSIFSKKIRIIERDPVIFSEWEGLDDQIFGLNILNNKGYIEKIIKTVNDLFPQPIAENWSEKFRELERRWIYRNNKNLSTGEKITLSFARALSSWDREVKLVVADECDSALDTKTQELFMNTLESLSKKLSVYYISHIDRSIKSVKPRASFNTCVFILGCNKDSVAETIPLYLSATESGTGQCVSTGNIGQSLLDTFIVVKKAIIHTFPHLEKLEHMDYTLDCNHSKYDVGETRSAGLAIAIALLNISQLDETSESFLQFAATGNVLLDGTVEPVKHLAEKVASAKSTLPIHRIVTPNEVFHLSQLPNALISSN